MTASWCAMHTTFLQCGSYHLLHTTSHQNPIEVTYFNSAAIKFNANPNPTPNPNSWPGRRPWLLTPWQSLHGRRPWPLTPWQSLPGHRPWPLTPWQGLPGHRPWPLTPWQGLPGHCASVCAHHVIRRMSVHNKIRYKYAYGTEQMHAVANYKLIFSLKSLTEAAIMMLGLLSRGLYLCNNSILLIKVFNIFKSREFKSI